MNNELVEYINTKIIPQYTNFDGGHKIDHVLHVINFSLYLCRIYNLNKSICLAAAAYHDIGLAKGRDLHHLYSSEYVKNDVTLRKWFSNEEINIIADACFDHRASSSGKHPRSIYGEILVDADRTDSLTIERMLIRSWGYNLPRNKEFSDNELFELIYSHLTEKYGAVGYSKYILKETEVYANASKTETIKILEDKEKTRNIFNKLIEDKFINRKD